MPKEVGKPKSVIVRFYSDDGDSNWGIKGGFALSSRFREVTKRMGLVYMADFIAYPAIESASQHAHIPEFEGYKRSLPSSDTREH